LARFRAKNELNLGIHIQTNVRFDIVLLDWAANRKNLPESKRKDANTRPVTIPTKAHIAPH